MKNIFLWILICAGIVYAASCELCSFVINDSAIAEYNKQPKPSDTAEVFKILKRQTNFYYMDRDAMDKGLEEALADYPELHRIVNNNSYGSKAISKKLMDNYPKEDSIVDYVWLNSANMDSLKYYISQVSKRFTYSATAAKFLENMKNIVFADSTMMHKYALSLFAASLGVCYDTTDAYQAVKDVFWTDAEIDDLFRRIYLDDYNDDYKKDCAQSKINEPKKKNVKVVRNPVLEKYCLENKKLKDNFKFKKCSEGRWNRAFAKVDELYTHLLKGLVDSLIQKGLNYSDEMPVVWNYDSCGCSLYRELNGNVYAIYPYWLNKEGGSTIDFSVITRIGYYGIYADNEGRLKLPSGLSALSYFNKPGYSNFVNAAHKHNVKVDWIINKGNWNGLSNDSSQMERFFKGLIEEVDLLVSKKNISLFEEAIDFLSINGRDVGRRGDGVTIWFKNYPTDELNKGIFRKFFGALQSRLRKSNEYVFVNMMMNLENLLEKTSVKSDSVEILEDKGIYSYEFFGSLLEDLEEKFDYKKSRSREELNADQRNFLIVLNNEPISRNKLVIYNDLNQQMKGDERTEVLHAVVPMLWLDYKQWEQLKDDASFYNDAFYSLGIAPYGVNDNEKNEDKLSEVLLNNFEKEDGTHERQNFIASFFCMNRWMFRMLNTLVYVFVFLLLTCYFLFCRVNAFFTKRLALFIAVVAVPPLLTTLVLSNFDPAFMDFVGSIGRWGCFVVIVLTVIVITLLQVYRSTDVPKRK